MKRSVIWILALLALCAATSQAAEIKYKRLIFKDNNIRLGNSGNDTMTGKWNFLAGDGAGAALTSAGSAAGANIAIGKDALKSATTGTFHIAIGDNAAAAVTTNSHTTAIGFQVLSKSTAQENVGVGAVALRLNTTGQYNAAFGNDSMTGNTTGSSNSAFGQWSMFAKQTGDENSAFGGSAMFQLTAGNSNTGIGYIALGSILDGNYNTSLGASAGGVIRHGSNNLFLGAGSSIASGVDNVNYVTAIGSNVSANCTSNCTVIGGDTDDPNGVPVTKVGIGIWNPRITLDVAGDMNLTGFLGLGGAKTGAHGRIGSAKLSVDGQVAITDNNSLYWAGNTNTKIVYDSGPGFFTSQAFSGHYFNLYDGGYVTKMTIDINGLKLVSLAGSGSRAVNADANGLLSAASDERMKENFVPLTDKKDVLSLLKNEDIKAVYYNWKDKTKGERRELGMTAQMWENVIPEIQGEEGDGHKYLDYQKIAVILWEQNKALLKRIEALEAR